MIPIFKIRCSEIGAIMGEVNRPTEKQLALLSELQAKDKRTEKQEQTLQELIAKRDAKPELSDGAKKYCQKWLKEQLYGRRREFSNKYTEKGISCENSAIEFVSEQMGYGMIVKNEMFYENEFITGTPDLVLTETVEDIKNSWDCFTFPLFDSVIPNQFYFYQVQGYMELTGKNKGAINYCLIDAPEELIDREARNAAYKAGLIDVEIELYEEVRAKMTYSNLRASLRLKRFEFNKDEVVINQINTQVKLCRDYITILSPSETTSA